MESLTLTAKAIKRCLFAISASSLVFSGYALSEDKMDDNVERIEVTGSRIQRADMETSSPITVIDRAQIDASGMATVSDFVRNLAENSFGSFREASGYGSGQASQSTVSLRGLGPERTLVLIDGRRMGTSVAFGGGTQNLNVVPMAAVERIEVLRDGASAVYGSDAVAGVINIITKKEYEGIDIEAEQGITQHGGAENTNVRMTFGSVGEKTNIVASVEYFNREPLYDSERDFSNTMYSGWGWPGTGNYKQPKMENGNIVVDDEGNTVFENVSFADSRCDGSENSLTITDSKGNQVCAYNAAADSATMAGQERFSTFVKVDHEFNEDLKWTNRVMMSRVWTEGQYAASPNSNGPKLKRTTENAAIYDATVAQHGNAWLKAEVAANRFHDISLNMRTTPLGPRVTTVEDTDINFLTALEGYQDVLGGLDWSIGAQWIRSDTASMQTGTANASIIQDLLDSGELDFFGAGAGYVDGSAETAIQQAAHTASFTGRVQTYGVDAAASFDLFELPSGTVPIAVGMEWNRTEFDQMSDAASNQGHIVGSAGGDIIQGKSRQVFSAFAETVVPVIDNLDLELSARFDNYSDFGSTFNPKVGMSYRPVEPVLVRASWGTGFRAPTFNDLYANASTTFLWAYDKVGCANGVAACEQAQYPAMIMGNENLDAEESESLSLGVVWNITDALDMELSYYDITIDNVITTMHSQDVFDLEAQGVDVSDYLERDDTGAVKQLTLANQNLGEMKTSGVDFNVRYLLETNIGEFRFGAETNYVLEWKEQKSLITPAEDVVGELSSPEYKVTLSTIWSKDNWDASLFARYTAGQEETYTDKDQQGNDITKLAKVDNQWIVDVQGGYYFPWNGKLNVGIRNLLDEEPPMEDYLGFPYYDTKLYDPIGREYYLRYNQKF